MTPEGWGFMSAAIAVAGSAGASAWSVRQSRKTQREAAKDSPYEALAERVVNAEKRITALESELQAEREKSAHLAAAFRTRIQVLLRHIAALDEYAQVLADLIRVNRVPFTSMPQKPELLSSPTDEL